MGEGVGERERQIGGGWKGLVARAERWLFRLVTGELLMCVGEFEIRYPGRDSDGSSVCYMVHSFSLQRAANLDPSSFPIKFYPTFAYNNCSVTTWLDLGEESRVALLCYMLMACISGSN